MRRLLGLLLGGLLTSAAWAAPLAAAAGYTMQTTAQYVVDPAAGRINVTVQVDFSNTTPDPAGRLSAFDRIELPVQEGASQASAADDRGALAVELAVRDGITVASVTPRTRVRFEQEARFTLSFVLADQAAPDLHIRPEVVEFVAWGFGTASEVTIDLLPNLEVRSDGDPLTADAGPERIRLSSGPIADPTRWLVRLTAIGQTTFTTLTRRVTLASATVEVQVRAWSTDQAWGDRVAATVAQALPRLEAEVGLPYPRVGPLVLVESVPAADATEESATSSAEIQVDFSASAFTLIHQLAHVWASPQLVAERWLREGLASHLAERVAGPLAIDPPYAPATRVTELATDAFPLEEWGAGSDGATADAYGYAASWAVIDRVAEALGEAKLRLALARGAEGLSAYDPAAPSGAAAGPAAHPIDSRRMLDLLTEVSGVDLGDLFGAQVFGPAAAPELHLRAVARLAYRSLLEKAGDWGAPDAIRAAMAAWAFDDAIRQLGDARRWLGERDRFLLALDAADLTPPDRLRERYRAGGGGRGARAELDAERAVVEAMAAAEERVRAPHGIVEQIGLFASDDSHRMLADARVSFTDGDLRTASQLIAAAEHRLDGALVDGLLRIGAAALLVVVAVPVVRARRGRRTHYTAAQ